MAQTEARKRASAKYTKEQIKTIGIRFHREKDADILRWLDGVENKTEYCRELIRRDMAGR